ncbi:hypothetical protein [Tenacibaculum sp. C7A-26P2]|uniref:hypothetical protein n=1 Tax=Tenacibaculum sp. C7A-26P2 TaxID=3447504 RepID=UPI003F87EA0C
MKKVKGILASFILITIVLSCSSNDDEANLSNNCGDFKEQTAQGNFRGKSFTVKGGTYKKVFDDYSFTLFIYEETSGDPCFVPQFNEGQDVINITLSSAEPQSITISNTGQSGTDMLSFIRTTQDSNGASIDSELSECGTIEIISVDSTTKALKGRVVAKGVQGSEINGNFTLQLCE